MEYTYKVTKLKIERVFFILIFKVVSEPTCCMEHLFVNLCACVNYCLMFWSGDTGGMEIIWDYLNKQWCGETKL